MAVCDLCGGLGWITVNDLTRSKCRCAYARELKAHITKDVAMALSLESSPFYEEGVTDLTQFNLFIKVADIPALLPHLKWVLTFKGLSFKTARVTDAQLKEVWVGDQSYAMRSKKERDDVVTFNCLADLIGAEYHLVIIQLGYVRKNVRLPDIILEALMLREALGLSTWIVEQANFPFVYDCPAFSAALDRYITENFEVLTIKTGYTAAPVRVPEAPIEDVSLDDPLPEPRPVARPAPRPAAPVEEARYKEPSRSEWALVESQPKRRPGGWKPRKQGGGGGPLGGLDS